MEEKQNKWFYKFYKPDRLRKDQPGYEDALIKSHADYFKEYGYDFISKYDSVTGKEEWFPRKPNLKTTKAAH